MSYEIMRNRLLDREGVKAGYDQQAQITALGRLFRRARETVNLRIEEVATRASVAQSDMQRLEMGSGENGPTFDTLVKVARALDMKLVLKLAPIGAAGSVAREDRLRAEF